MWLAVCACAQADEGVLLRSEKGLRSHLCGALRIQLTGTAEVYCESEQGVESLAQRIASTAKRVRERGARLGLLLEADESPGRVRMYIVSTLSDRAVIAIESIEDRPEPDVDRSLALKVLDAYQVVTAARVVLPSSQLAIAATLARPAPTIRAWLTFLDAGGGVSVGSRKRTFAAFALGMTRLLPASRLELGAGARLASRDREQSRAGQVSVFERGGVLTARLLLRRGRFELGGAMDGLLSVFSAEGVARDGSRGERRLLVPSFALALDVRYRLFANAFLRAAPALELSLLQQRWAIDGSTLIDQGLARVSLPLSLVVALPLSRRGDELQP